MAPQTTVQDHGVFERLTGTGKLQCVACSEYLAYDKIIRMKTKSKHIESEAHQRALRAQALVFNTSEKQIDYIAIAAATQEPISIGDLDSGNMEGVFIEDDGIYDQDYNRIMFSAGESINDGVCETCVAMNNVLQNPDLAYQSINDHLDGVDEVEEADHSAVNSSFEDGQTHSGEDEEGWFPYGNRTMFFLDLLDNLPRLRLSDDHMRAILWVMKECGTPDVPSFYALRKLQEDLQHNFLKPQRHVSSQGTEFFGINPADLVRLDWANPLVRKHLHIYPEVTEIVSELWQAKKYVLEVPKNQLTPMWADWSGAHHRHFFVNEIAQLQNGEFVVPLSWVIYRGEEHAQGIYLREIKGGEYELRDPEKKYIPCSQLSRNLLDLRFQHPHLFIHVNEALISMGISNAADPHPVRTFAKGRPAFCLRLLTWTDDVSGNRSKQYNAHMNLYFSSANVPFRIRAQESFVHFSSTSPDVSALEQLNAFGESLRRQWHNAFDCQLEQEIIFQMYAHLFSGDNPMQAELCSNMGSMSRHWCRSDLSGGTKEERETNEGYHALYQPGEPRQPNKTIKIVENQLQIAANGVQAVLDRLQRESGIKDSVASYWCSRLIEFVTTQQHDHIESEATRDSRLSQKLRPKAQKQVKDAIKKEIREEAMQWLFRQPPERYSTLPESEKLKLRPGDHYNVLLSLPGVDIHRDTPVEILHTVLLGIDKYVWYETSNKWNQQKEQNFSKALSTLSTDGLSIHSFRPRYIVQYKNSLIGRDFKILQQIGIFPLWAQLNDGTWKEKQLFQLWKATGELGALLWIPEINDMDNFLIDIDTAVKNVLDSWGAFDPTRVQYKYKLHTLTHLTENISRFGPPILYATEVFEAWNGIFRYCSVLSNHQSPSRDIAETLAGMERVKHFVGGGWWKDSNAKNAYISAGEKVKNIFQENKDISCRLGFSMGENLNIGTVKLVATASRKPRTFRDYAKNLTCEIHVDEGIMLEGIKLLECEHLVSQHGDVSADFYSLFQPLTRIGSCVVKSASTTPRMGRIYNIISPTEYTQSKGGFDGVVLIQKFQVLGTRHEQLGMPVLHKTPVVDVVASKGVLFIFNAQPLSAEDSFVLNLHAIHNSHLIRHALPRTLTKPIALYDDATRLEKHNEWASGLWVTGPAKRKASQLKSAATKQKNKEAAAARSAG